MLGLQALLEEDAGAARVPGEPLGLGEDARPSGVGAVQVLQGGANDLGGTLMDENISRAAGATHGQLVTVEELQALATSAAVATVPVVTGSAGWAAAIAAAFLASSWASAIAFFSSAAFRAASFFFF